MMKQNPSEESVKLLDNDEQKTQLLAMIEEISSENKKWLEGDKCEQSE